MQILPFGRRWVSFASYQPRGAMVSITIAFVITRHHVENDGKLLTEEEILKAGETASDSGKHSPTQDKSREMEMESKWQNQFPNGSTKGGK